MKSAEGHWWAAGILGALSVGAVVVSRENATFGVVLAFALGCGFGWGHRNTQQLDRERVTDASLDARVERFSGRKGA